jgi:hypothetical protein
MIERRNTMSRSSRMLLMFASALIFVAFFANFCVVAAPHLPGPKIMHQTQGSRPTPPPVRPEPQPGGSQTSGADVTMAFTSHGGGTMIGVQPIGPRITRGRVYDRGQTKQETAGAPTKFDGRMAPLPTVLRPPVLLPPMKWVPAPIEHESGLATGYLFRLQ